MDPVLEPLLQSPRLTMCVEELNHFLAFEQAARQKFRDAITDSEKGEFINGQVTMHSPARMRHTDVRMLLSMLLRSYVTTHRRGWVGDEKVLIALTRNDFEPDIVFYGNEKASQLQRDQTLFPAPDLVVEVLSESTEQRDRGIKMEDYTAHGVREYWLVDPEKEFVEQYELEGEHYTLRAKLMDGSLRSNVVAGFSVPARAVFDRELNLQVLSQITSSPTPA